jgi:hypothetical protein
MQKNLQYITYLDDFTHTTENGFGFCNNISLATR